MKIFLIVALMCGLNAQDFDHRDRDHEGSEKQDYDDPDREHKRSDKMQMMMVWKLTDELALSPEQAEKFFPRFRQHRDELDEVRKMEWTLGDEMKQKLKKDEDIPKKDVKETVKKITELRKKIVDLEGKFILGMDNILSPRQLANLGMFKQKMMRDVGGELREKGGKKWKRDKKKGHRGGKKRRGF
ncbi:MAG TPA: hypothetical protein EYQ37_04470 [Candidatus Marinimicrobia bacterium]|nr:hypothetical protein [Candidatus Neomarinimicrobiota bacterium]